MSLIKAQRDAPHPQHSPGMLLSTTSSSFFVRVIFTTTVLSPSETASSSSMRTCRAPFFARTRGVVAASLTAALRGVFSRAGVGSRAPRAGVALRARSVRSDAGTAGSLPLREAGGRPRRLGGLFSVSVTAPPSQSASSVCDTAFAALDFGFGFRTEDDFAAALEVGFVDVDGGDLAVVWRLRFFSCGFSASEASSCSSSDADSFRLGDGRAGEVPMRDRDRVERAGEGDVRAKTLDCLPRERAERVTDMPSSDELLGGSTTTTPHLRLMQLTSLSLWIVESARKRARLISVVCSPS